jgi:hypothetical protein
MRKDTIMTFSNPHDPSAKSTIVLHPVALNVGNTAYDAAADVSTDAAEPADRAVILIDNETKNEVLMTVSCVVDRIDRVLGNVGKIVK